MKSRPRRILIVGLVLLLLGMSTDRAEAQMHEYGSMWLHRDADHGTMLHAGGDTLCVIDFPSRCYGGMMLPDSLFCAFSTVPTESLPDSCHVAFQCAIEAPDGGSMMQGHMTGHGFFRENLQCTFHYDPEAPSLQGIDPSELVIVMRSDNGFVIVDEATHDPAAAVFVLSTPRIASWYGIFQKTEIPLAVQPTSWADFKGEYR